MNFVCSFNFVPSLDPVRVQADVFYPFTVACFSRVSNSLAEKQLYFVALLRGQSRCDRCLAIKLARNRVESPLFTIVRVFVLLMCVVFLEGVMVYCRDAGLALFSPLPGALQMTMIFRFYMLFWVSI